MSLEKLWKFPGHNFKYNSNTDDPRKIATAYLRHFVKYKKSYHFTQYLKDIEYPKELSKSNIITILKGIKLSSLYPHLMAISEEDLRSVQLGGIVAGASNDLLQPNDTSKAPVLLSPIKASSTSVCYGTPICNGLPSDVDFKGDENATPFADEFDDEDEEVKIETLPSFSVSGSKSGIGRLIVIPAEDYHDVNDTEIVTDLSFEADDLLSDDAGEADEDIAAFTDAFQFAALTDQERASLISTIEKHGEEDDLFTIRSHGSPIVEIKIGNVRRIFNGNFDDRTDLTYDAIDSQANLHNDNEAKLGNKNVEMERFLYFPSMFFKKILFRADGQNIPTDIPKRLFCNLINRNPFLGYSYLLFTFASKPSNETGFCFDKSYREMSFNTENESKKLRELPPVWVVYVIFISSTNHSLHGTVYYSTRNLSVFEKEHIRLVKKDINQYLYEAYCGFGFEASSYSNSDYADVKIKSENLPSGLIALILQSILPRAIRLEKCSYLNTAEVITRYVENVCDDYEETTKFKDRIAFELAIGKSINYIDNKRIISKPNLPHYSLRSSISGSLVGGSTLDMASNDMPGLQWVLYNAAVVYGMLGCLWLGAAAHIELLESIAKFNDIGGPNKMLFVSVEIQYCPEIKPNVTKLFGLINPHTKDDSTTSTAKKIISLSKFYISVLLAKFDPYLTFFRRKLTLSYGCFIFGYSYANECRY